MNENKISISIPEKLYQDVLLKLTEAKALLSPSLLSPYVIALQAEERRALPKMGDKTFPFVEKALEYAQANPALSPGFIDMPEWQKDNEAHARLTSLYRLAEQLCSSVDDTMMLCGSESYTAALGFYNSVRQAAKMNVTDAKPIAEDLAKRFPGRSIKQEIAA